MSTRQKTLYEQWLETDEDPYEFISHRLLENVTNTDCIWCDVRDATIKLIEQEFFPEMKSGFIEEGSWFDAIINGILLTGIEAASLQDEWEKEEE